MKNDILDIWKEDFLVKTSFILILFFPVFLLFGSSLINTSIVLLNILFLIHIYKKKTFKVFNNDIFYFLIAFWVLLIINTLLNDNFENNYSRGFGFIRFILLVFSFSYFLSYKNYKFKKIIFNFWTIFFIIVSLDLIFEYIFGFNTLGFRSDYNARLSGFMGDELKIGHWYLCFTLLILSNNFTNLKQFYFIVLSSIIISFLIGERGNFIRLFLALTFLLIILKKINYKNLTVMFLAVALITLLVGQNKNKNLIKERFINDFVGLVTEYDTFKEFNNHNFYTPMYVNAYNIFLENKILGVGAGSYFKISHEKFRKIKQNYLFQIHFNGYDILPNTHPHQHHFEILATLGLPGYLFLLFFFLYFFNKSIRFYLKTPNILNLTSFLFVIIFLIPLLPTGSFFTTYGATMFWINFSLMNLGNFKNINY